MSLEPLAEDPNLGLENLFGHSNFRGGQREVIDAVLGGDDALVVMPTGSGKSLCYQLPACLVDGVSIVVSPLIALMKDQVDQLSARGLPVTFINSSISRDEQMRRMDEISYGGYKIVYVAPERFKSSRFVETLQNVKIGLFAVDEAHCISQWGHDFRPDYRRLGAVRQELGSPRTIALTATATPTVQEDILHGLGLDTARVFVRGFERPNLEFEVFQTRGREAKEDRIEALCRHHDGESVVVYCATRKQVKHVTSALRRRGLDAAVYHGGMPDAERAAAQDSWASGELPILVATNAFGMGVDKADVRAVIHYNMPASLEAYYQEAGRAGRDGEPSNCLLLFNYGDRGIHEFFIENSFPDAAAYRSVWNELRKLGDGAKPFDRQRFAGRVRGVHPMGVDTILRSLRYGGYFEDGVRAGQPWLAVVEDISAGELEIDWEHAASRRAIATSQLKDVVAYASTRGCRQNFIVEHFGGIPQNADGCGTCDHCAGMAEYAVEALADLAREVRTRDEPDILIKKLLAGLARARGRFGAHAVAQMLRGANTKKMRNTSLGKLSTFGILSDLKQDDIVHLLDVLARHGLAASNQHGCLGITDVGNLVMLDEEPPPASLQQEWEVCIKPRGAGKSTRPRRPRPSVGSGSTYDQTLELYRDGNSADQIAEVRGIQSSTVLDHLVVLADRGESLDVDARPEVVDALADVPEYQDGDSLRELRESLDVECSYEELKLGLVALKSARRSDS